MEGILLYWLAAMFALSDHAADPAQQAWRGRQEGRQLDCTRMSQAAAHERHPAAVPPPTMRGTALQELDALVCERRMVRYGTRNDRDELVLSTLHAEVTALAQQAMAGTAPATRWLVDAYYPQPEVARKIANATRTTLAAAGQQVSSQPPLLAAADVAILHGLPIADALPWACRRLAAEGTLEATDAFLAVALVRAQETQLHAGICQQGGWRWLR
jgi:hypothetical protein